MQTIAVVPHASRVIPTEERQAILLNEAQLQTELGRTADIFAAQLVNKVSLPVIDLSFPVSRLVCDITKQSNVMTESMEVAGRGAVPYKCTQGDLRKYTKADRERILNTYYIPWYNQLEVVIQNSLETQGMALVLELRTFNAYQCQTKGGLRAQPHICLGVNDPKRKELTDIFKRKFKGKYSTSVNVPFGGCVIPFKYARDQRVHSMMISVNQILSCIQFEEITVLTAEAITDACTRLSY